MFGARLVDERLAALARQTVTVRAEATIGRVIAELAREVSQLASARERLAAEIETVSERRPLAPVLLSIPGIGARTAPCTTRPHATPTPARATKANATTPPSSQDRLPNLEPLLTNP